MRRTPYADMLRSSRDYWRRHFPHDSNQALPEAKARDYLYQLIGMVPHPGSEDADGNPTKPLGSGLLLGQPRRSANSGTSAATARTTGVPP
ncbi:MULTISPECIES: hypothetical protein [unclassified Streptomyces]|uniref:hypothetical protein n=1 Tax=unclassified Streptomyces TaxID=2593676 RepID=UPI00187724FB|nr:MULTISPECIES: hypothetical protein [unclassified Streptomyces]